MCKKLNPCPKCGNPGVYVAITDMCRYDLYQVVCENIPDDSDDLFCFEGPEYKEDEERAIREYNKIVSPSE
jgi:ssDNA-binding Zn-finger/Zn-ribbon topoisomerase 1